MNVRRNRLYWSRDAMIPLFAKFNKQQRKFKSSFWLTNSNLCNTHRILKWILPVLFKPFPSLAVIANKH